MAIVPDLARPSVPVDPHLDSGREMASSGSATKPGISFDGDPDTGIFNPSQDVMTITCGGVATASFTKTQMLAPQGTFALPYYSFGSDNDTGIYLIGPNSIGISAGGGNVATFAAGGGNLMAGCAMSAGLLLSYVYPTISLNKSNGEACVIATFTANSMRWSMRMSDTIVEGGANAGSDFTLYRYSDTAVLLGGALNIVRATGIANFYHATVGKPGGGSFTDNSDIRIKNIKGDYKRGLDEIVSLRPIMYTYKGNDTIADPAEIDESVGAKDTDTAPYPLSTHYHVALTKQEFIGLAAQDVEKVFPECVSKIAAFIDGKSVKDLRNIDVGPLLYALINAVKELDERTKGLAKPPARR